MSALFYCHSASFTDRVATGPLPSPMLSKLSELIPPSGGVCFVRIAYFRNSAHCQAQSTSVAPGTSKIAFDFNFRYRLSLSWED